jgi:hemoglobin
VPLPLTAAHFNRWLTFFNQTLAENFNIEKAEEAIARAQHIAAVFQYRLKLNG